MAAYFETGFSVRKPMWHQQGTVLEDYPADWDDARKKAGLLWEPTYADLFVQQVVPAVCRLCLADLHQPHTPECPTRIELGGRPYNVEPACCAPEGAVPVRTLPDGAGMLVHVPAEGHQAIVRDDTWAVLATPTDSYRLIQHSQMGELLEAYSQAWRKAGADVKFETAGSVRGNAHDGSAACKLLPTQVGDRLEQAKDGLASMRDEANAWQLLAADLAGININDAVVATFLDEFIPVPEGASERTRNARLERQATFRKLYTDSPTVAPLPDSAYKLVQAAGEYLDHLRPYRSADTYLARTMFSSEPIKGGAVRLVRQLAKELAR